MPTQPIDRVIAVLEAILETDALALTNLLKHRVGITVKLDQQTEHVILTGGESGIPTMSTLGLVNSLLEAAIGERVAIVVSNDGTGTIQMVQRHVSHPVVEKRDLPAS